MGRHAQLVMGPAGSGKSTYCNTIYQHCQAIGRTVHVINLDPAADELEYQPSVDIRSLITVDDVMDELNLGPNGGLMWCFEYVASNHGDAVRSSNRICDTHTHTHTHT
jgi:GPN-loop GTPase